MIKPISDSIVCCHAGLALQVFYHQVQLQIKNFKDRVFIGIRSFKESCEQADVFKCFLSKPVVRAIQHERFSFQTLQDGGTRRQNHAQSQ